MSLGEQAQLVITSDMAYGAEGRPPVIPPNSDVSDHAHSNALLNRLIPSFVWRAILHVFSMQARITLVDMAFATEQAHVSAQFLT